MTRINCRTNEGKTKCLKFTSKLVEKKDDSSVDRVLVQSVKTNSRQPLNDVTARFNARTGCGMSQRTICRRLLIQTPRHFKEITISPVNSETRPGLCRRKLHSTYKISGLQLILVTRLILSFIKTIKFMSGDDLIRGCVLIVWVSAMTGKQIAVHQ